MINATTARVWRAYCAGARVLNLFSYTGAFAISALAAGASSAVNVDSSQDALAFAESNAALNARRPRRCAPMSLNTCARTNAMRPKYDVIVLDPPKLAHNPAQIDKAARAYKDVNRLALRLLKPGGVLATFSCSGVIEPRTVATDRV